MLSPEKHELIECAIAHSCPKEEDVSKQCSFCLFGYKYIANKPTILECDHHICEECKSKAKNGSIWCKFCKSNTKCIDRVSKPTDMMISDHLKELVEILENKFQASFSSLKEREIVAEKLVACKKFELKNQIDLRVENLKEELDNARKELHKEVDSFCDSQLNKITKDSSNNESFEEKYQELQNDILILTKEKFYEYQKHFKKMLETIQKSYEFKVEIDFKSSSEKVNTKGIIGSLNYKMEPASNSIDSISIIDADTISSKQSISSRKYLVSASDDKTIKIWNLETNKCIKTLEGHSDVVLFILPLGNKLLASSSKGKEVKIWNVETGSCVTTFTADYDVGSMALINENILVTPGGYKIKFWDLTLKKLSYEIDVKHSYFFTTKLIEPNLLAIAGLESKIKFYDLNKRELCFELEGHNEVVRHIELIEPNILVSSSNDKTIRAWDIKNRSVFAVGDIKSKLSICDLKAKKIIKSFDGHSGQINSLALISL